MTDLFAESSPSPTLWQRQLADAFSNAAELCRYLELPIDALPLSHEAAATFPLRVPRAFAERIEKGNPSDPLLLQVLPLRDELTMQPGFSDDPVGDLQALTDTGLLHKYRGRVLMINTGACAIHCRYCFRRNFPYSDHQLSRSKWAVAVAAIQEDPSINEVILSGGDPLMLSDSRLDQLLKALSDIPHLKRLRIHSRLPVVLPDRITPPLLDVLAGFALPTVLVMHCNHARELDERVGFACRQLQRQGIMLLNQAVLLKGVNDRVDALRALSERLLEFGILPYYLHLLDKAQGTAHFDVPRADALALMAELQASLPGYLVPKLVVEQAGAPAKQAVVPD